MKGKTLIYYLAIGFLILGLLTEETEARRKILRGRKTITRRYYRGTMIPAWSIILLCGIGLLVAGGGMFFGLQKFIIDAVDSGESHAYQPTMQDEV